MSWSVRGEEQEAGKAACTAGIISLGFGREWQRFITCLSKCIIEQVTPSIGAVDCAANTGKAGMNLLGLKNVRMPSDVHQERLWRRDSYFRRAGAVGGAAGGLVQKSPC